MQLSEQAFPAATMYNYLFHQSRSRNRVEFIDDFPNEAEVISSIQIHPMGWNALSRNVSCEEDQEWTCVHDIQNRDPLDYDEAYSFIEPMLADGNEDEDGNMRPTDIWMGFMTNELAQRSRNQPIQTMDGYDRPFMGVISSGIVGRNQYTKFFRKRPEDRYKIVKNLPRLTHYKQELPVGKGYIKELCYSTDGRIICSPHDNGVRLLSFNDELQEVCHCVPDKPKELHTIAKLDNLHSHTVVSCKFNPKHYQMVSGCLGGKIVWYKPIL